MFDIFDLYVLPWFKRLELVFWRYPWASFSISAMLGFWIFYWMCVIMAGIWKGAVLITILVIFGVWPLIVSCRIEDTDEDQKTEQTQKLREEIKELETQ